jgi:hypothetical protein
MFVYTTTFLLFSYYSVYSNADTSIGLLHHRAWNSKWTLKVYLVYRTIWGSLMAYHRTDCRGNQPKFFAGVYHRWCAVLMSSASQDMWLESESSRACARLDESVPMHHNMLLDFLHMHFSRAHRHFLQIQCLADLILHPVTVQWTAFVAFRFIWLKTSTISLAQQHW